ncbi:hypothetical protein [Microlunatus soli]|uniref:Uncharacterized protein n=1 Tax=Microlunatus soli TaxID=630515 RepID=A0A1H1M8G6_9ACTN|nr:hypothetical protein [Microlunatus soli]SDR83048.1 hypothetical protein SAMN04489812_0045 [Microlunatus soli]
MASDPAQLMQRTRQLHREPISNRLRRWTGYVQRYRRLQRNLRHQHAVLPNSRARAADPANRTHFLINFPGSPSSIAGLVAWLPVLDRLSREAPVAILVGDVSAYRAVQAATRLPCYFGRIATEAEYVAQQMETKVMVYINQSKLNLREGGFHDMFHVFLGAPGSERTKWLSNRMRLYDYVLAPDEESKAWLGSRLMGFDAEARVRVVGRSPEPDGAIEQLEAHFGGDVASGGVDVEACVAELLRIRNRRDDVVRARENELAEQGIVLVKGGQV